MPTKKMQTIPYTSKDLVIKIKGQELDAALRDQILELVVDSNRHMPDMFTLKFYSEDPSLVDKKSIEIGDPVEITVKTDGTNPVSLMKGEITAIEPEFRQNSYIAYVLRGYDKSHRLYRGNKTRAFTKQTDSQIAQKIGQEAGLTVQAGSTSTTYDHVWQNNQTDMEFLRARAVLNGFQVYYDGDKLYFDAYKPAEAGPVDLDWGHDLQEFTVRVKGTHQADKVKVISWDPAKKQPVTGEVTSASSTSNQGGESTDGGATAKSGFKGSAELRLVTYPEITQGAARGIAQSNYDEMQGDYLQAEGRCYGNPKLRAGGKVNIKNVGTRFSGTYVLTSVTHIYTAEGYETVFSIHGRRSNSLAEMLSGGGRAGEAGHRQLIPGVVPAIVTNNNDPDGLGRVKVKYPWLEDQLESFWARLSGPGAGIKRGVYFVPEVNDEVLVAFEHGDINQPFIIGEIWNKTDTPPKKSSEIVSGGKTNERIIQSRTGHIITLNDTAGKEQITVVDKSGKLKITMDSVATKIIVENTGGDIEVKAPMGKVDIKAKEVAVEAQTSTTMKGMTVSVQGQTSAEVKSAQLSLKGDAMVQMQGGIVKIN